MGIDLGTSSVKTLIANTKGKILAVAQRDYRIDSPRKDFAEQNPENWWCGTSETIREVIRESGIDASAIKGVGLSGQMHGTVLIDKYRNLLRPAIIWCDQRSELEVKEIYSVISKEALGAVTLNRVATGFQLASLLWIKTNEPVIFNRIDEVILPKDYIRLRLTDTVGTDYTDASSTLAFNCVDRSWAYEVIERLGIDPGIYPDCKESIEISGEITPAAAKETGLMEGIPVVYGGGDQPMQAIGNGIIKPGMLSVTIGSGGQVFTPVHEPFYDSRLRTHTFCNAVPGTWNIMGASLCAGLSLKWLAENIIGNTNFQTLSNEAEKIPPGSDGLLFLPYLAGERTPHMDNRAKGVFFGLTLQHTWQHMVRAIMEGVAFSFRDSLTVFNELGINTNRIIASGGGAASGLWLQILADVLNLEVFRTKVSEQACMGAAITAGVGVRSFSSFEEACELLVRHGKSSVNPINANLHLYDRHYAIYRQLYKNNRKLFRQLGENEGENKAP